MCFDILFMSIVLNSLPVFALEIWTWPQNSSNLWSVIRHFLNRVYLHRKQCPAVTYHFIVFTKIRPKYEQTMYPNLMLRYRDLISFRFYVDSQWILFYVDSQWILKNSNGIVFHKNLEFLGQDARNPAQPSGFQECIQQNCWTLKVTIC